VERLLADMSELLAFANPSRAVLTIRVGSVKKRQLAL
jgi:hypothetical protein